MMDDLRARESSVGNAPLFVLGHSHGGLIAAVAGERGILRAGGAAGCILCSPYLATCFPIPALKVALARIANRVWPSLRFPMGLRPQWLTRDLAMLEADRDDPLMNRVATPRWYFTARAAQQEAMRNAERFTLPLLCLAGDADVIADPKATGEFHRRARSTDKTLHVYPHHVHELLREPSREQIFADILTWIRPRRDTGT